MSPRAVAGVEAMVTGQEGIHRGGSIYFFVAFTQAADYREGPDPERGLPGARARAVVSRDDKVFLPPH